MICKKTRSAVLISLLIFSLLFTVSCKKEEKQTPPKENLTDKIEKKLDAYRTDLMDSADTMKDNTAIRDYLENWAKSKGISYKTDSKGIVLMTRKASEEYKGASPTAIICPYDSTQFKEYYNPVALALYTIKNNENTGPLTVAFVPEEGHDFSGMMAFDPGYIKEGSNIICLNAGVQGVFATSSGGSCVYRFTQSVKKVKPTFKKAYTISITGLPGGQPDSKINDRVNPIGFLRSLLASFKSRNIQYEIGSFTSGDDPSLMPETASVTITVDADHETAFLERIDKANGEFEEAYGNDYPEAVLTCEEAETPKKVIADSDCSRFVSFMYTLLDGVYYRDDSGTLISINAITSVKTGKDAIVVTSVACSLDPASLKEIDTGEETLCTLSDVKYEKLMEIPPWNGPKESDFYTAISRAFRSATGKDLTLTSTVAPSAASYLTELPEGCDVICISVNDNIVQESTAAVIQYLIDNVPAEEE